MSRARLVQLLNEGQCTKRKQTLVSAPAGFGKTTLVVDWLKQIDLPAAWLSLDEATCGLIHSEFNSVIRSDGSHGPFWSGTYYAHTAINLQTLHPTTAS